ncbi:transcription termination factor Rho [Chloroflexota bacterium]
MNFSELDAKKREELLELAKERGISGYSALKKQDLILRLLESQAKQQGYDLVSGMLEVTSEGYAFLRQHTLLPRNGDVYVSLSQVRRFSLRTGDTVTGQARPPKEGEKYQSLLRVELVNDTDPDLAKQRKTFDVLTPIFPDHLLNLETAPDNLSTRLINLVTPIGRGQRGLIVAPPKTGKTILLKMIANAITINDPDVYIMVCLIGERPEEVTDMKRSIDGEVVSATFDEMVEHQTHVAELALERAKRLVEAGRDVIILLDGITRLTRAYNLALPPSGRTLSGGIDPVAIFHPKRFFGAARNVEEGGSLTILATCLIDTGSRMDEVIYEEFKGTGNMELHLDRRLSERWVFPAIDITRSSTRREELLTSEQTSKQLRLLRRMTAMLSQNSSSPVEATELVLERLAKTPNNADFLNTLGKEIK